MHFLLISQALPFNDTFAQDTLDLAIGLTTFEQTVQLLFLGDGVLQLLNNQQPNIIYRKDFITTFRALDMYDIGNIYVDEHSLLERNISSKDLIIDVAMINTKYIASIMDSVDIVLHVN